VIHAHTLITNILRRGAEGGREKKLARNSSKCEKVEKAKRNACDDVIASMPGACQSANVNFASAVRARFIYVTRDTIRKQVAWTRVQILRTPSLSADDVRAVTLAISCALPNGRHSNAAISPAGTSVFGYEKDLRSSALLFHRLHFQSRFSPSLSLSRATR
jgi:hypothetical protein